MANAYDDLPPLSATAQAAPAPVGGPNAYDDITPPFAIAQKPKDAPYDVLADLKHMGGMALRAGTQAVTSLPFMAEDMGVAARNLGSGLTGGSYHAYDYPSDTARSAMDTYFGKPQGMAEKIEDAILPMAVGMGASRIPGAASTLLGGAGPAAAQAPMLDAAGNAAAMAPSTLSAAQTRAQMLANTLRNSQAEGYVVPRATTNPTTANRLVEMLGGKVGTAQEASVRNQATTNKLAARSLGLSEDAPITLDSLNAVRAEAGKAYDQVRQVGPVKPDQQFADDVGAVRERISGVDKDFPGSEPSPLLKQIATLTHTTSATDPLTLNKLPVTFDANAAVTKIKQLRDAADVAGRSGDKGLASGYKDLSDALESQIGRSLQARVAAGDKSIDPNAVANFQAARQQIAKTYTVQKALNPANSDVSTASLASQNKAKPGVMSGDLLTAANFGGAYEKAAQSPAKIGSAGVNHLEGGLTGIAALLGGMLGGHSEHGMLGTAAGVGLGLGLPFARRGAVNYALGPGQAGAIPSVGNALADLGPAKAKAALIAALQQSKNPQDAYMNGAPTPGR